MRSNERALLDVGLDGVAVKPAESDVATAVNLPVDLVTVDFEGTACVPSAETLAAVAERVTELRVTVPVRADGFDPLGDDDQFTALPDAARPVFVAGHPDYLDGRERARAVAPRLGAAVQNATDPWVGSEGIERIALATGATQFSVLSPETERELDAIRAAGFDGGLAVYAPVVVTDDDDAVLDAIGDYVARRGPVRGALPEGANTDASASGMARTTLVEATDEYALVGTVDEVRARVDALRAAGADDVVGYPAQGLETLVPRD